VKVVGVLCAFFIAPSIAGITTDYDNEVRAGNTGFAVQTNGWECTDIELMSLMENYPM
jgi:hypothetical protein